MNTNRQKRNMATNFLMIDNDVYLLGASVKDMGVGMCAVTKMLVSPEILLELLNRVRQLCHLKRHKMFLERVFTNLIMVKMQSITIKTVFVRRNGRSVYRKCFYDMKQIEVVAAIIRKDDKIFATQRGYGDFKDWWEFPGGKMEDGETPEEALVREIREELSADISVDEFLCTVEYDYPQFHLTMHCYLCSLVTEALHLNEHEAAKWLAKDEMDSVKWLPADVKVVEALMNKML